ncbi:U-box domain-containing protein 52 [Apostasia shenzhenica]|uniref:RING-type E3 ubiquitin transferase n=1 Tax=Apostasia shenzhenica TaxID=1088818 RepID=A0A2I0AFD6_9ASPA|nr:U-box domain-containing protein 52 [Apostasia shenzhenica]
MKRLRSELKHTMKMYSNACREALTAQHRTMELHRWKVEGEHRIEEARKAEEAALAMAHREKAKAQAAMEAAEASKKIAELETKKRQDAEMKAVDAAEEKKKVLTAMAKSDFTYRRYDIGEIKMATDFFAESLKIGEGGYGPVFGGRLDHTLVAIKVLRLDTAQGRSQFQQELEILSCIRHPNMVLLLGACLEFGCLVYEFMANGSLEDRLSRRGNSPPIPWQHRFRIAAEIATGLLFLHQTKPKPLVHRDLKPANILLDHNFVSKISDVGLARLVPSVADNVTQSRMTSAVGTFCYIDPEYQQTGMLGIKSDVYSLGILLLQLITGRAPMGLTHQVERAVENGEFEYVLDPTVEDWPVEEALSLAKMALRCAELKRKDRPDLGKVVLPELDRLRKIGESNMQSSFIGGGEAHAAQAHTQISMQDLRSGPLNGLSGYETSRTRSSVSLGTGRRFREGLLSLFLLLRHFLLAGAISASLVGVNYGLLGNNLPSPNKVAPLLHSIGVGCVKLYDADPSVLRAFANTGVELIIGVPDYCVDKVRDPDRALVWTRANVQAYLPGTRIAAIIVGNEILTGNDTSLSPPWNPSIPPSLPSASIARPVGVARALPTRKRERERDEGRREKVFSNVCYRPRTYMHISSN